MANAVNALHITEQAEKCRDASFPKPVKGLMIGQLRIFTEIIKRMVNLLPGLHAMLSSWLSLRIIKIYP